MVLDWDEMTASTPSWNIGSSVALGRGTWRSPRWSGAAPESRIRRKLGSSGLRRRELGDTRERSELGGSKLRGMEYTASPLLQAGNEEARLLQVVRLGLATSG